jgi:hypothetical protein
MAINKKMTHGEFLEKSLGYPITTNVERECISWFKDKEKRKQFVKLIELFEEWLESEI